MVASDTRPCKFCIANVREHLARIGWPDSETTATAEDCEFAHRDDPRVYNLARAMAKVMQSRRPSDEQVAWFLEDANDVVDDFDPPPVEWSVHRLPRQANDGADEIEVRLRINGVTYVALEGGKDSRGSLVKLAEFRRQIREANTRGQ
jgi:hypothetical protein